VWQELLADDRGEASLAESAGAARRPRAARAAWRWGLLAPQRRWLCGVERRAAQPIWRDARGTRVSLY
jgi:hypothetical protein